MDTSLIITICLYGTAFIILYGILRIVKKEVDATKFKKRKFKRIT